MRKVSKYTSWAFQIIAAVIMLQTLYFKFTGAAESVYIFSKLGIEPVGRIGSGIAELIASVLLLIPSRAWLGAILAAGIMAGAILSHLTILGIEIMNDRGQLFAYAIIVLLCSIGVLWINKRQIINIIHYLTRKKTTIDPKPGDDPR